MHQHVIILLQQVQQQLLTMPSLIPGHLPGGPRARGGHRVQQRLRDGRAPERARHGGVRGRRLGPGTGAAQDAQSRDGENEGGGTILVRSSWH